MSSAGITEGFSMCGGDFVEVYNESSHAGKKRWLLACLFKQYTIHLFNCNR